MKRIPILLLALFCICSCATNLDDAAGCLHLDISPEPMTGQTKSLLTVPGIENEIKSLVVAGYDRLSGDLAFSSCTPEVSNVRPGSYNIYVLANMGDQRASLPSEEGGMAAFKYRIPSIRGLNSDGIPMCGRLYGAEIDYGSPALSISVTRLVAKVNVTIDQTALDGPGNAGRFVNQSLHIRQSNMVLKPFGDSVADASCISDGDYDSVMKEGSGPLTTYTYYVPENLAGTVQGLTPSTKLPARAESGGFRATFAEFAATVAAEGLDGDVLYRFCLGADNYSDYNVRRNCVYNVSLALGSDALFGIAPEWKVDSGLCDRRDIFLSRKPAVKTESFPSDGSQKVVVRPGRPIPVYLVAGLQGAELYAPQTFQFASSRPESGLASTTGWMSSSFRDEMRTKYGVDMDWNGEAVVFSVSDASRFRSNAIGKSVDAVVTFEPGCVERRFKLVFKDDVTVDVPNAENFHMGMKRTATLKNCNGSSCMVRNISSSSSSLSVLKTAPTESASFIGPEDVCIQGLSVGLYAFRDATSGVDLRFSTDDWYNDGTVDTRIIVRKPIWRTEIRNLSNPLYVAVDGTESEIRWPYATYNGGSLPRSEFDDDLWELLMKPKASFNKSWVKDYLAIEYVDNKARASKAEGYYNSKAGSTDGLYLYVHSLHLNSGTSIQSRLNASVNAFGTLSVTSGSSLISGTSTYSIWCKYPTIISPCPSTLNSSFLDSFDDSDMNQECGSWYSYGCRNFTIWDRMNISGGNASSLSTKVSYNANGNEFTSGVASVTLNAFLPGHMLKVPYGNISFKYGFTNQKCGESVCESVLTVLKHTVHIGQFWEFTPGTCTIYFTAPKIAYLMKQSHEAGWLMPSYASIGEGVTGWGSYISYKEPVYNGYSWQYRSDYSYGPSVRASLAYLNNALGLHESRYSEENAERFFKNVNYLGYIDFRNEYGSSLSTPLRSEYINNNSYFQIYISSAKLGYSY